MSDTERGVGTQTKKSNLAVNDCIRNSEVLKDAWVIIKEVRNLVKNSPCRETTLKEIREMTKNKKSSECFFVYHGLFTGRCVHLFSTILRI